MNFFKGLTLVSCLLAVTPAVFADDNASDKVTIDNHYDNDASRDPASSPQVSEAREEGNRDNTEFDVGHFALRPSAGAVFYNGQEKFTGGVLLDMNFLNTPWAKIGPATGALYSSASGGDFFNGVSTNNNAYIFQIPANLKATFAPDPGHRLNLGVHGGANIVRSTGTAGTFGSNEPVATTDTGASWDVHPNVGADVDFALSDGVDLTLRPDVTFLDSFNMTTATLGLALKL